MLREANEAVRAAREAGKRALPTEQVKAFVDRYSAAVRMGLAYHRGLPAHRLRGPILGDQLLDVQIDRRRLAQKFSSH